MKQSEMNNLLRKFWLGSTTRLEDEQIFSHKNLDDLSVSDKAYLSFIEQSRQNKTFDEEESWKHIAARSHRKRLLYTSMGVAASLLVLVSLFVITSENFHRGTSDQQFAINDPSLFQSTDIEQLCGRDVYINGCKSTSDCHSVLQTINPKCIQQISMSTQNGEAGHNDKVLDVWLKAAVEDVFAVCEGTLFFYQDGEIKSIRIEDECSPNLLVDCREVPLTEIEQMKPSQVKSIALAYDLVNCSGQHLGEYIVLESK